MKSLPGALSRRFCSWSIISMKTGKAIAAENSSLLLLSSKVLVEQQTQRRMFRTSCQRLYKGEAGEEVKNLTDEEKKLLDIAIPKSEEIMRKHIELPNENDLATRRKRLIYRSKQRGWLEVDLLLGTYASEHVPVFDDDELDQFENFVNMETIDIYNVITLRMDVPDHMKRPDGNSVVERIQEWARSKPLGTTPEKYEAVKTEHKLI